VPRRTPFAARAALAALVALLLVTVGGTAAQAGDRRLRDTAAQAGPQAGLPTDTQQQVTAERPIPVPPTASCTETLMVHDFANSYYQPYTGTYAPTCAGPWSKVVLTFTGSVAGVQFDRTLNVAVGHALLLRGSTSEPCCTGNRVNWAVQRDVTQYASLLASSQPVLVQLDNVNDSTYTGVYHTTLTLTFYSTSATVPAAAAPDVVLPVTSTNPVEPTFELTKTGQRAGSAVTFPRNLSSLRAELFADGHGPCEEFWYTDPGDCAGTPYREVAVYLDGALAGAAPVYPVAFTGLDGPGLWEPIPSPRAWDLRPYDVDLTPFVGTLTDGAAHSVRLGVLGAVYQGGDYWPVAANLLGTVQHDTAVTTGGLLSASAAAAPTNAEGGDPTGLARYTDTASHELTFTGYVDTPAGRATTTVHDTMGETENMDTTAVGLAFNGVENEDYGYADDTGTCYHHRLGAQAGEVTVDQLDALCPSVTADAPGADVPEAPYPLLLVPVGLLAAGLVLASRGSRQPRSLPH